MSYSVINSSLQHPLYPLRIEVFIRQRINELNLSEEAFILLIGMRNFKRKQKKLHHLFNAKWSYAVQLVPFLATALRIPDVTLNYIIDQTKSDIAQQYDRERRTSFQPRAYFETTLSRPTSITMAGFAGATRYIDIVNINEMDFVTHVMNILDKHPKKIRLLAGFYGDLHGFSIAYTPDLTVHFDLQGHFVGTSANGSLPGFSIIKIS